LQQRAIGAVDRAYRPLLQAHDIPGMAVGVTVNGVRQFVHYGVASRASNAPVTQRTLFEIGSLSKTFTATLAGYAEALGRLSLADTPGKFVPALRGTPLDRATLLQFGTYTAAGLPLQFPDEITGTDEAIRWLRQFQPQVLPGAERRYSNPSIGLLGHATAVALGGDFGALSESQLFPGLGLAHTAIRVPAAAQPDYAWGYNRANQPVRVNPGAFDAQAYGVKTTIVDMLRFVEANIDPRGLPPALRRGVERTHVAHDQVGDLVQGLGWEQYPWPVAPDRLLAGNANTMALDAHPARALVPPRRATTPTLFSKTGSTGGFGGHAAFVPARGIGIVMLANRNIPNAERVKAAHAVLQAIG
ncbi:MAG: beta-lactamase, partial [Comamonadaceae bacterium]